jgi:hypothetical protein
MKFGQAFEAATQGKGFRLPTWSEDIELFSEEWEVVD